MSASAGGVSSGDKEGNPSTPVPDPTSTAIKDGESHGNCTTCHRKLGRATLLSCSQLACFKCCTDPDCVGHRDKRALAKKNDAILAGTSWINRMAAEKRALAVKPGTLFREPAVHFLGDTVLVWSLAEFFKVPKWREDAIRRSRKNRERMEKSEELSGRKKKRVRSVASKESRKKRAHRIMERLYQESLKERGDGEHISSDISEGVKSEG
uniref:Uncharacterized protein n=1 Tax=Pseudictyota dubia TaxID=2749911 RepID=A0A7R9VVV6_9STRA